MTSSTCSALIRSLRTEGVLVIYVSHRLEEVMQIADRVTVIKDGRVVGEMPTAQTTPDEIVRLMAGRRLDQVFPARRPNPGPRLLATEGLTRAGVFADVTLDVKAGESSACSGSWAVAAPKSPSACSALSARRPEW